MTGPTQKRLEALVEWYRRVRRDLPWRRTRDPYSVWISETMLQQTRVETVVPYYERFLAQLPTVQALAEAPEEQVLTLWSGLGYYRRARMLHAAAQRVVRDHDARIPGDPERLRELEGVGRYTAGAVASIAFSQKAALVDGNVARVLARLFAIEDDVRSTGGTARVWEIAEKLVEQVKTDPGEWNQALMELGATVCTPGKPSCGSCPLSGGCEARARGVEALLPRARVKRPPVQLRRVMLVVASRSIVGLARRKPGALFGGLWEPPGLDVATGPSHGEEGHGAAGDEARRLADLARSLGIAPRAVERAGVVEHVLTHRHMHVTVARADPGRAARKRTSDAGAGAAAGAAWAVPSPEYDAIEAVPWERLHEVARSSLVAKVLAIAGVANLARSGLPSGAE
jgi:A/G-specific adenine glycosylase